jgi:peptidyl-tRNA hydrolase ICT1
LADGHLSWCNPLIFNRTETKATTVYPVNEILAMLPANLHRGVRCSNYYVASSDSLTFQDQTHRSKSANADENRRKLIDEVARIYQTTTPAETGKEKKKKYEAM